MYIARLDAGPETRIQWARIVRVAFSKTGRTLYYDGRILQSDGPLWYLDTETRESFWIHPVRPAVQIPIGRPCGD
jgi:hypothetical protein